MTILGSGGEGSTEEVLGVGEDGTLWNVMLLVEVITVGESIWVISV